MRRPLTRTLVIGSGPAAAGAALALCRSGQHQVTVIDLGLRLEQERQDTVNHLSTTASDEWSTAEVQYISAQPVGSVVKGLPEKRTYGSDFPFRDLGQLRGITSGADAHHRLVSAAYGGFSNVWGAQLMPFTDAAFQSWPVSGAEMAPAPLAVLDEIPFAGEHDDLAGLFPLIGRPDPLPEVSERSDRVLQAYRRHRSKLRALGVTVGKARLAFQAPECVRCRLCMTGCPYGLIYSAAQTFDELRRKKRITYHGGLMALGIEETAEKIEVRARELASGQVQRFEADRVFVACGAFGSTRLILNSLGLYDRSFSMGEAVQFMLPMLSARPTRDPRPEPQFTLNQFNVVVALDPEGLDLSLLHCYAFNPAVLEALPRPLRSPRAEVVTGRLLSRLSVALGYLPSWGSPRLMVRARPPASELDLPGLAISREPTNWARNVMLRRILGRLLRAAPRLDLYPFLPGAVLAAGGKSYHWGGSFPHAAAPVGQFSSDLLGRVGRLRRVHVVDAAVFPNVPSTTYALTIMANAHRIASAAIELPS